MSLRILLLSSVDPTIGPARQVVDMKFALEGAGHKVDLYTKYQVPGRGDIKYILKPANLIQKLYLRIMSIILNIRQQPNYFFFYKREIHPPVNSDKVVKSITGQYDLVYVLFWQGLLSFETVNKLYDKYQVPFIFSAVDFSVMTGGCHFMGDCTKYQVACGKCPGYRSFKENDFTRLNINYRKKVYQKINPVIICNSYTKPIFESATLTKGYTLVNISSIINENAFLPKDRVLLRTKYAITSDKKYLLLFGCQNLADKRKGVEYLLESLSMLYADMTAEQRKEVLVLSIGKKNRKVSDRIKFDLREFGYVDFDTLSDLYSLAYVYLSTPVIDAGPMMVNQALMCGTPVVAFNIGSALDVVQGKETGYCAEVRDAADFTRGIRFILALTSKRYEIMSEQCRKVALDTSSYSNFARKVETIYCNYNKRH